MSHCVVLSDSAVHDILINLHKDEIIAFQHELRKCLIEFSTGEEREFQPPPGIVNRPNGQKTLFRPFTSPTSVGTKIIVDLSHMSTVDQNGFNSNKTQKAGLHGILALCDNTGIPTGIINADEVTGYRTSMSAMIPYMWRRRTENIVVFGAGKQALWHLRLALGLRGAEIKSITVVNRSQARAESLLKTVEEENAVRWKSKAELVRHTTAENEDDSQLETLLSNADVIFCTVPSEKPLFPARYLTKGRSGKTEPFVSAIGSWQPSMIELDPALLRHIVDDTQGYRPTGKSGSVILVDDRESALLHAGEVTQSNLREEELIEVGEALSWQQNENHSYKEQLTRWLEDGFVVYKSVGVSVTDLVAGNALLRLAKERNTGFSITNL